VTLSSVSAFLLASGLALFGGASGALMLRLPRRLHGEALSDPTTFSRFLQAHAVDAVVVTPGTRPFLRRLISTMGVVPVRVGDTLVYLVSQAVGQARVDILAPVAAKSRP
jgi:hypothetical protein